MKTFVRRFVPLVLLVALVAGGVRLVQQRRHDLATAAPPPVLPVVVERVRLHRGPVTLTLPAMGVVASHQSVTLSTKVSGRVTAVTKEEGEAVAKGEVLVRIDADELAARRRGLEEKKRAIAFRIEAARANKKSLETALATARAVHARTLELLRVNGASEEQASREEAEIAGLEAKLAAAAGDIQALEAEAKGVAAGIRELQSLLRYATVTAPIDGIVARRLVQPGDLATPGRPLVRITATNGSGLYLDLSLPAGLRVAALRYQDRLLPLAPKNLASATGLAQYLAELPSDAGVLEGQFVDVEAVLFQGEAALVPTDALLTVNGATYVLEAAGGRAVPLRVEVTVRGRQGAVVRPDLDGRLVLVAKPDILLRAMAGVPLAKPAGAGEIKEKKPAAGEVRHG